MLNAVSAIDARIPSQASCAFNIYKAGEGLMTNSQLGVADVKPDTHLEAQYRTYHIVCEYGAVKRRHPLRHQVEKAGES